jgi:hypothetical protein
MLLKGSSSVIHMLWYCVMLLKDSKQSWFHYQYVVSVAII